MRHIILFLAILCTALTTVPARAETADIAAAARSVVRVVLVGQEDGQPSLVGHGSGVAVGPDIILTNAHVVAPAREDDTIRIGVVPSQGKSGWFARVIAVSPGNDLALIKLIEPGALPPATFYSGPVADGADVFAVGYPGNVDLAQGLTVGDLVMPATPVKTRGNISGGRSSKQFDTLLHTAPIGAGNSGGPLLDECGRVIGINSFGTVSDGSDSEFFFAVSMREISRFLLNAGVRPRGTGTACRSLADLNRADAERHASEREHADEAARTAQVAEDKARRAAQLGVISERENGMALAGLALLLALTAGGSAVLLAQKGRKRDFRIAIALVALLLGGSVAAWMTRPSLAEIDTRTEALLNSGTKAKGPADAPTQLTGDLVCVLDLPRSRVTVSGTEDVALRWQGDGCTDGRTPYANGADGWFRVTVPTEDETVTVSRFDPATGRYEAERYLLDYDAMAQLRAERSRQAAPACGGRPEAAARLLESQTALKALLPGTPNERLVYDCRKAQPSE